jgi:hypothetical protein
MRFGVSYFGVRDPRHARRDLDEIAAAGFRTITHTFSEHDLRWHVEDVGRLVEESRARGLETALDPWGVAGVFGGEAYSELALVRLDARQRDAEGVSVPAACPSAPATVELLRRWAKTAVSLAPDVLFWDEPHFHLGALRDGGIAPCCRCAHCEAAWHTEAGGALPPEGEPELAAFRNRRLVGLLEDAIAAAGSGVRHSLCLLPRGEFEGAGSDAWEEFASLRGLSRLATDPYWMDRPVEPAGYVRRHAAPLRALCDERGLEAEVWVQGIVIAAGRESDLLAAADVAAECGADVVSFWSFRGTERMAKLACADPDAAWRAMCEAVTRHGSPA